MRELASAGSVAAARGAARRVGEAILVFRIGSIGDTVVALPALRRIRACAPDARIVLLTNLPVGGGLKAASSMQILDGTGLVDEVVEYPHGSRSLRRLIPVLARIRALGPRTCYFLMYGRSTAQVLRDRVFFHCAGIRRIVGLDAAALASRRGAEAGLWESEAVRLLRAVGADPKSLRSEDFALDIEPQERTAARAALTEGAIRGPYFVLGLGSKVPVNDWGDDRWIACLRALGAKTPDAALVAIGSQVEAERSARVLTAWPGATANLCGRLTPRQSAALIEGARLYLGHDSGPMHLAAAVTTPLVAVFSGRNPPGEWFPFGQERNVIMREVSCGGCRLDVCTEQRHRCMTEVTPIEVVDKAIAVMHGPATGHSWANMPTAVSGAITR